MTRLRSLFGRVLWGGRHWTQEPLGQSPTAPSVLLVGISRERSLEGAPRERAMRAAAVRDRSLSGEARERGLRGIPRERTLKGEQS